MNQQLKDLLHLYLPHKLGVYSKYNHREELLYGINGELEKFPYTCGPAVNKTNYGYHGYEFIPLMRPIMDVEELITISGDRFVPVDYIQKVHGRRVVKQNIKYWELQKLILNGVYDEVPYWVLDYLVRWHFWVGDQKLFKTGDIIRIVG